MLTIKEEYKHKPERIKENVIESWFKPSEIKFLEKHDVIIKSKQLFSSRDFNDYELYEKYSDDNYSWKFQVFVDGKLIIEDYANSSDYITSHMNEIVEGE